MKFAESILTRALVAAFLLWSGAAIAQLVPTQPERNTATMSHAKGSFDVKTSPMPADEATTGTAIGRFALDKEYHGDLAGTGRGEMLGAGNPASGTAGYVAIEQVTGTLHGHKGSFALQHFGAMEAATFELKVTIVPGSGTEELKGIAGTMTITQAGGKHSYSLDYTIPATQ